MVITHLFLPEEDNHTPYYGQLMVQERVQACQVQNAEECQLK